MNNRASGILLHITSLPSQFGIGDLGPWAYRFADLLAESGQSLWQVLPLTPPRPDHYSPYLSPSAFAGNWLLVSPELLVQDGLLTVDDLSSHPEFPADQVEYRSAADFKARLLQRAYESFLSSSGKDDYEVFCRENSHWLDDFALFMALQEEQGNKVWSAWPSDLRDRDPESLEEAKNRLNESIAREKFHQFLFFKQWRDLKRYCNERGVRIFGDVPIYVDYDSADVWTHPELFKLDQDKRPTVVSGVPPDYFSKTGQLWGHPIYRWDIMKQTGYQWWMERIEHSLRQCDLVRIDHFRGLVGYWEVPAGEETAIKGTWVSGPGRDFLRTILDRFQSHPIVAEDLGLITPDVIEVKRELGLPGMKVLLFAFGGKPTNPYLPHNMEKNCVAYTGTHDNNTARGWFEQEASELEKQHVLDYLGYKSPPGDIHWALIRLLMMSVAHTVVFPVQDILGLGAEARMNTPSVTYGNWRWRLSPDALTTELWQFLLRMTKMYGRVPASPLR